MAWAHHCPSPLSCRQPIGRRRHEAGQMGSQTLHFIQCLNRHAITKTIFRNGAPMRLKCRSHSTQPQQPQVADASTLSSTRVHEERYKHSGRTVQRAPPLSLRSVRAFPLSLRLLRALPPSLWSVRALSLPLWLVQDTTTRFVILQLNTPKGSLFLSSNYRKQASSHEPLTRRGGASNCKLSP